MLALDAFEKRGGRPPTATSSFLPTASAAAAAAAVTSESGHLHLQPHQPPFEAAAPHKDDECGGSSEDDGELLGSERSRRRFVKPTTTTYEHCFSRNAGKSGSAGRRYARRAGAQPRVGLASYSFLHSSSSSSASLALAAAAAADAASDGSHPSTALQDGAGAGARAAPRTPAVSSLSSALQELMHGRHRALSSYVDATAPQTNQRTFVVKQDSDGTFYVASSTGEKFAADSAIGKVFLQPAPERKSSAASLHGLPPHIAVTTAGSSTDNEPTTHGATAFADPMRRSDLDFSRVPRKSPVAALRRSLARRESVEADESSRRSSFASSKVKLLGLSTIKSKLTARRNSFVRRNSLNRGSDRPMTLNDMALHEEDDPPTLLGGDEDLSFHVLEDENALPMLDPDLVDARARGDSSWEVAPPAPVLPPRPTVDKSQIVNRPIPYASGSFNDNDDDDDDDDDDNLLNRSFLNVRDIEFNPRTDKDAAPVSVSVDVLETDACEEDEQLHHQQADNRATFDESRATFDESRTSNATRDFLSGYRGSSLSAGPGTRMSAGNVSEFLGGFKGQLSTRRTSMGQDGGGYTNRARSVRNSARKSAAASAANAAATALTRKLRDARSRIPFEFRDDLTPPSKAKKRRHGKKLRVRWDLTLYCREFEVESEDEEEAAATAAANIVKAPWEYRDSEERESDDDDEDDE